MTLRQDFPIFTNNPGLIFLDSTASSQKPQYVIDSIKKYLENDYSNIHRGMYTLAERSEAIYENSKKIVAKHLGAKDWREVIYTFNANYALNLLALTLKRSKFFQKGDIVLVSIVEHHANIVPWLILKEEIGIEVQYVKVHDDYSLDIEDLTSKLTSQVKVVSLTHVSNVSGEIFPLEKVGEILANTGIQRPLFVVDASQSVPHFAVDVQKIGCDFLFFTGHKVFADSGIGVLWGKKEILEDLQPGISGGGAISKVTQQDFISTGIPDRFEAGTPNVTGAASLLAAFEYIDSIGGYQKIEEIEQSLVKYTLNKFHQLGAIFGKTDISLLEKGKVVVYGNDDSISRVGVFSFEVVGIHSHDIAEYLAENNICIRAGQHCAEPFLETLGKSHTCRMSLYVYNTFEDIDDFFVVLQKAIQEFCSL